MRNIAKHLSPFLKFLFRRKLSLSSEIIHTSIRDAEYGFNQEEMDVYHEVIGMKNESDASTPEVVHPLFYTKVSWKITERFNEYLEQAIDVRILDTIVHQSEDITIHQPLTGPCLLKVRCKIWNIEPHRRGTKMTIRFQYFVEDQLMATQFSGGLFYGVRCIGNGQRIEVLPKAERIEGPGIRKDTLAVEARLSYEYAEKAQIDAGIHTDPVFAKGIGLPDIILQGTCTFARSTNLILGTQEDVKIRDIRRISAKFTGMVVPPATLTVQTLKKDTDVIYFDVLNPDGHGVIKGGQIHFKAKHTKP